MPEDSFSHGAALVSITFTPIALKGRGGVVVCGKMFFGSGMFFFRNTSLCFLPEAPSRSLLHGLLRLRLCADCSEHLKE